MSYDPWTQHLYSYCGNNPVNMIDPTGHTWQDVGAGVIQSIADNFSWGGHTSYLYESGSDYYKGRWIGDMISMGMGLAEMIGGGAAIVGMWGGEGLGIVFSGGAAAVAIPLAVAGTAATAGVIGHGATFVRSASKNAGSDFSKSQIKWADPDVSIQKQLAGKGQLKDLRSNPNLKNVNVNELLNKTPAELEKMAKDGKISQKTLKQIKKAFEGRDLGKRGKN